MPINDDLNFNNSSNPHFQDVLKEALKDPSRRNILRGGLGLTAMFALPMLPGCGGASAPSLAELPASTLLGFNAVTKSILDQVVVPAGYTVKVLHATGDRLNSTVTQYSNQGLETDDWSQRVGDHHDGMDIFYIDSNGRYSTKATNRAVLAVNHESSADSHLLHPKGQTSGGVNGKKFSQFGEWDVKARPGLEVLKEINLHGISVAEITLDSAGKPTGYVLDSALNRRITPQTVADVQGPAAHLSAIRAMFATRFDNTGATSRGTLNNCGHGITPWGTYLGCEENWAVYFNMPTGATLPDAKIIASRKRYGVSNAILSSTATAGTGQGWYTPTDLEDTDFRFTRWNVAANGASAAADFRNEPHTFGYNLELDPLNPTARPAKRTAMGRFAHEAAVCGIPVVGKPLAFYMAATAAMSTSTSL
jgi:secreted PhoX family phosphatase